MQIDEEKAKEMMGKLVLVGVTYRNSKEEVTGVSQYFGIVKRINITEGLVIERGDTGLEMNLPPMLERYEKANPGRYNLKSSNMTVDDPDYVATWTVYPKGA